MNQGKVDFFDFMRRHHLALTFDDVLISPEMSDLHPAEVSMSSRFSRNVPLRVPLVSAAMDTVTDHRMAIAMAKMGGLGVVHAAMSVEQQKDEVRRVKLYLNGRIDKPRWVLAGDTVESLLNQCRDKRWKFRTFPVVDEEGRLVGVLSQNDLDFCDDNSLPVSAIMTPMEVLTVGREHTSLSEAYDIMISRKVKTLPLVDREHKVCGLYVFSDVKRLVRNGTSLYNLDGTGSLRVAAAVPTDNEALERISEMRKYIDAVVIDTAQGDSRFAFQTLENIKNAYEDLDVVVGNISSGASAKAIAAAGADGLKVGQGGGCFQAGTRVLMADASYKNIEDIKPGDRVINMHGNPVTVRKAWCTGTKPTMLLIHSNSPFCIGVTPDHRFWATQLSAQEATPSWRPIGEGEHQLQLLSPRAVQFGLPSSFDVEVGDERARSGYELGYLFGFFLGSERAGVTDHDRVIIYLRPQNASAMFKLSRAIEVATGEDPRVLRNDAGHPGGVELLSPAWAKLFTGFGEDDQRRLPSEYMCSDLGYLQGMSDGLLDANASGRPGVLSGTSSPMIAELLYVLNLLLYGRPPQLDWRTLGGLPNWEYSITTGSEALDGPENTTLVRNAYTCPGTSEVPVYDIEVDCPTHSFVAGNTIVHNSICTTRIETGMGKPQVTAVYDCARAVEKYDIPVCSDGGVTKKGDVSIAIAAGAHSVMMGRMFAGTDEAPGDKIVRSDGSTVMMYRGMGSASAIRDSSSSRKRYGGSDGYDPLPEGVEAEIPYQGPVSVIISDITKALRKSMAYVGSKDIAEHRSDTTLVRITNSGLRESQPHDIVVRAHTIQSDDEDT